MNRCLGAALALVALLSTCRATALAQSETGEIVIRVVSSSTLEPIANASVFMLGGREPMTALTDADGLVRIDDVQPALYRVRVDADGYERSPMTEFEVLSGQVATVYVKLASTLKTIANVKARTSVGVGSYAITSGSAQRKLSDSLLNALGLLPNARLNPYGAISLNGYDPAQTLLSINGVRVGSGRGASGTIGAVQDLFTGANVNFDPNGPYIGGSIDFYTVQPTKTWQYVSKNQFGPYGSALALTATGSIGKLGIAVGRTFRGQDDYLSGLTFEDESGLTYPHMGANDDFGNLLILRFDASKTTTVKLGMIHTDGRSLWDCTSWLTALPCGYGPSPPNFTRSDTAALELQSLIGHVTVSATVNANRYVSGIEAQDRRVGGIISPYSSSSAFESAYGQLSLSTMAKRHTYSLSYDGNFNGTSFSQTVGGTYSAPAQPFSQSGNLTLNDNIKSNEKLNVTYGAGVLVGNYAGAQPSAYVEGTWNPTKSDSADVRVGYQNSNFFYGGGGLSTLLNDPVGASFDCANRSTLVSGPSDPNAKRSTDSYSASYSHRWLRSNDSVGMWFSTQSTENDSFNAALPIAAEPPSAFPGGITAYLNALQQLWSQPTVCGSAPFQPQRIWVNSNINGVSDTHLNANIDAQFSLGRNVLVVPSYWIDSYYLHSLSPRMEMKGSYYRVGEQVPQWPLHGASVIVDVAEPRARFEWLLNAQYAPGNNWQNLPAYTVWNGGVVFKPRVGTLTFTLSNIFGVHTGLFSQNLGINPLPLIGGGTYAFPTMPLPPRGWSMTYEIPWSAHTKPAPPTAGGHTGETE